MVLKVIEKKLEVNNCFSLILEKPQGFSFYAGQYLDVKLDDDSRTFTISASPTESYLMVTTTRGISDFKKAMAALKPGDTITTSHPVGTFILDETEPAVFIAGGIGITPFRSIIKYALDQKISTPITLLYSHSDDNFLYKEELENWKKSLPDLTIIYHNSSQNGHLTHLPSTIYHLPIYYLAGSPSFVDDMEKILLELGVEEVNIRYDRFDGYL